MVADFGIPGRAPSSVLVRPRLKSATHDLAVENEGDELPNLESNSVLISVGV